MFKSIPGVLILVAVAGAFGGFANALMSDTGLLLPDIVKLPNGTAVMPGFLGNILLGAVAALISFGLYGPFAFVPLFTLPSPDEGNQKDPNAPAPSKRQALALTLGMLIGAMLVGFSGVQWLRAETNKQLSQAAAAKTASAAEDLLRSSGKKIGSMNTSTDYREMLKELKAIQQASPREAFEKASRFEEQVKEVGK